jgi:hypothetical protein
MNYLKTSLIAVIILFSSCAFASQSTNFISNPNLIDSGGGK